MAGTAETFLGVGIYRLSEAARLTGIPGQQISRWLRGYRYRRDGTSCPIPPVWKGQLPDMDGTPALGFLDVMEARFVYAFRQYGVSLQTIRHAANRARELIQSEHVFSTKRFRTDGRTIFAELSPIDKAEEELLLDVVKNQFTFRKILKPYLYAGLEFEREHAVRWYPLKGNRRVVIDPQRAFGQPIVADYGVPTTILVEAYRVEQSIRAVAQWYDIDDRSVRDAVTFERQLAA